MSEQAKDKAVLEQAEQQPRSQSSTAPPGEQTGQAQPEPALAEGALPEAPHEGQAPPPPRRSGRGLALLALILALGASGGLYYVWDQQQRLKQQAAEQGAAVGDRLERLQGGQQELQGKIGAFDNRLDALQGSMQAVQGEQQTLARQVRQSLKRLETQAGAERRAWMLAETEYLLQIANRRLQLERDIDSALIALTAADARLQELSDPAFLPVRQAIANERNALRAISRPDIDGLALRLASVAASVPQLPLEESYGRRPEAATEQSRPPRQVSNWREFLAAIWTDIKGLVTIRHEPATVIPRLPPEQQYFLHQNVMLKLETARLALLGARPQTYHAALDEAVAWLGTYYRQQAPALRSALETLQQLQAVEVAPPLPDITASLRRLREVTERLTGEKATAGGTEQ